MAKEQEGYVNSSGNGYREFTYLGVIVQRKIKKTRGRKRELQK
ncbi:MAG: hypothetical protein O7161_05340 [Wolbachia endosymbiont of Halictus tumulorum]|nr:hypothetical protein [Wolbachia endosymbiont of Halictus tumulorum]